MIRPFIWTLFFMIIGIIIGQSASMMYFALFAMGIVIISVIVSWYFKSKIPITFVLFFLLGNLLITHSLQIVSEKAEKMINQEVTIKGTVVDTAYTSSGRQKITVKTDFIEAETEVENKSLKILAVLPENEMISIWDKVSLKGTLLSLEKNSISSGYNEKLYLSTRGYHYKIYIEDYDIIGQQKTPILCYIYELRENIQKVYDTVLPPEKSAILKAMVTGDKDDIDSITRELYAQAGIMHILAISGLHISLISFYIFYILEKFLKCNKRKCSIIVLMCLVFYLFFAGFSPSAIRAVIMIGIGLIGNIFYYESDALNNVAIAATCILLVQPLYLWDVGFQLSFIIVTGILLGSDIIKNSTLPYYIKNTLGFSFIASVVSFPIMAYHFYFVSVIGILVNIIILPLTSILLGIGMIVGIVGLFSIQVATFLSGIVYYILWFYEKVCIWATSVPYGYILWGRPLFIIVLLCYLLLLMIYFYKRNNIYYKCTIIFIEVMILIITFSNQYIFQKDKISFLDVGQGDAIVIQTYDKYTYIVDTGGKLQATLGNNTGIYTVLPYLQEQGISEIDGLFITHMDADHCFGAIELMNTIEINKIYISNYNFEKTPLYETFLKNAQKNNIPIFIIGAGDSEKLGNTMQLDVLYPYYKMKFFDVNDNHGSLVLHIKSKNTSILLTGDVGIIDETILLQQNTDLKSDILKVGHHGSKYSSTEKFLKAVQPDIAILSYGANNLYGHPHNETIERLQKQNIIFYETAKQGTITVLIDENGYTVEGMYSE